MRGKLGQGSQDITAKTELPGQDSQAKMIRI
jgi:hypothetical protein